MTMAAASNQSIQAVVFLRLCFTLKTPLSIGSGESVNTDHDCLRDCKGSPYVPAASICGLLRRCMAEGDAKRLMGSLDAQGNGASRLRVSDGRFLEGEYAPVIDTRDGVALDKNRVAIDHAKFDFEVIGSGASFVSEVDFKLYRDESLDDLLLPLLSALRHIDAGKASLGYKSTRGLGVLAVTARQRVFEGDYRLGSLAFRKAGGEKWAGEGVAGIDLAQVKALPMPNLHTIAVDASLPASLCVRKHAGLADGVAWDFEHLKDGGQPVLPGTSLAGACRNTAGILLHELGVQDADITKILAWLFGHVPVENKQEANRQDEPAPRSGQKARAWASAIRFREVKIKGGKPFTLTRVKIDRFTGGAAYRALFTERVHHGGKARLRMEIRGEGMEWAVGLMLLVLRDMHEGLTPLGGEVAVGRGLLELDWASLEVNGEAVCGADESAETMAETSAYNRALADFLIALREEQAPFPDYVRVAFDTARQEVAP